MRRVSCLKNFVLVIQKRMQVAFQSYPSYNHTIIRGTEKSTHLFDKVIYILDFWEEN